MRTIRITSTLLYCDGPILCDALDPIGGHYLVMSVSDDDLGERFVVAGIEPRKLRNFKNGKSDLLSTFTDRVIEEWYIGRSSTVNENELDLTGQEVSLAGSGLLPKPGFYLRPVVNARSTAKKSTTPPSRELTVSLRST